MAGHTRNLGFVAVLLLVGCDVDVEENIVMPGDIFHVEGQGNLGRREGPSLVCSYTFGGTTRTRVYDYDADGRQGLATCPEVFADANDDGANSVSR